MAGLLGFAGVVSLVLAGIHVYLWKRLVRDTTPRGRWRRAGTVAMVFAALLMPATLVGSRSLGPDASRWLSWPGYIWLALMFYLLVTLVMLEVPRAGVRLWWRLRRSAAAAGEPARDAEPVMVGATVEPAPAAMRAEPPDPPAGRAAPPEFDADRRRFLGRSLALVAGVATVGAVGYGMTQALGPPHIRRVPVPLRRLDPRLSGLRVALVADIHLGPILGRAHTERIVSIINDQQPDLVAIVGDLVDGSVDELGHAAEPLRHLTPRHGSFFVTGNHEYYSGVEGWIDELTELGVTPLQNQRVEVTARGAAFDLAGVNDVQGDEYADGHGPDFDAALGDRDTARPVVLLAHQPVQVTDAARHGVDLQLSGHTHGGQMVPFNYVVGLAQPVVSGLAKIDGTYLYVTNGAGFFGPPVRVGAPPEITVVELHPDQRR